MKIRLSSQAPLKTLTFSSIFLTAQNVKLRGQKLQHFLNDAFQSYYDLFQVN